MGPLIPIAINLLPELAKRLTGSKSAETIDKVTSVVRSVLNTSDPVEAQLAAQDPAKAAELRIRLAEIEAQAREAERQAQKDMLDASLARMQAQTKAELEELQARLGSQADARDKAATAAQSGSVYAYGPIAMSVIVTVGFFILLYMLIRGSFTGDQSVLQIVNIGFGTLTAGFATVISFWLGSSDSSRQKDGLNVQLQAQRSQETQAILARQAEQAQAIIAQQGSQTEQLIKRVDRSPAATIPMVNVTTTTTETGGTSGKGPKQFARCVELVFDQESALGALFTQAAPDPRGATRLGVTLAALAAWRGGEVGAADLADLGQDEAREILRGTLWNALGCQDLPSGLDLALFDYAVEFGARAAARALQSLVAVEADGEIGPITLSAVSQFNSSELIDELRDMREKLYRNRAGFDSLGQGWLGRLRKIDEAARGMLGK